MRKIILFFALCFPFIVSAQVGIGTTSPDNTAIAHVAGNLRIDGHVSLDGDTGTLNQILLSGGANAPAIWGPEVLNVAAISSIGKYYTGTFDINDSTYLVLNVTDTSIVQGSNISFTLVGDLPAGPLWGYNFTIMSESRTGIARFHIVNLSGYDITGLELSYVSH
ncbi:hypothetical protein KC929_02235 [Patescibacteria group bacterium]|mgnify:CR=1 FL=1|nr:hypothetical protein [Patescibacteria group bacterium]